MKRSLFIVFTLLTIPFSLFATRYYVKPDGNNNLNGLSWINAFKSIDKAINTAIDGDEIWVAISSNHYNPSNSSFVLNKRIEVYGGFVGTENSVSERDLQNNHTLIHGVGAPIFRCISANATIDGFHILNGHGGNGPLGTDYRMVGGGIYIEDASPIIRNCVIEGCVAERGGGIFMGHTSLMVISTMKPVIENTVIKDNRAFFEGGGIYSEGKVYSTFNNVEVINNKATEGGGYFGKKQKGITDAFFQSKIQGNKANNGAGLYGNEFWLSSSLVSGNYASEYGGGLYVLPGNSADLGMRNATIAGNYAHVSGGGIYMNGSTLLWISIIWGNHSNDGRNNIVHNSGNFEWSSDNLIEGFDQFPLSHDINCSCSQYNITCPDCKNFDANPLFMDYKYASYNNPVTDGDFHIQCGSPVINRSRQNFEDYDLDSNLRSPNTYWTLGAYEYTGPNSLKQVYEYDACGNRTSRKVLELNTGSNSVASKGIAPKMSGPQEIQPEYYEETIGEISVHVFPNPTSQKITIQVNNYEKLEKGELFLYNMNGQLLNQYRVQNMTQEIDLSNVSPGTYLLKLYMNDYKNEWEIIKN